MQLRYKKITMTQGAAGLLAALIARGGDFSWFGGRGSRWTVVPLLQSKAEWSDFERQQWTAPPAEADALFSSFPFTGGHCGVIPYEQFSPFDDGLPPLLIATGGALLLDQLSGAAYVASYDPERLPAALTEAKALLHDAERAPQARGLVRLDPLDSDDSYEKKVRSALEDIRDGRFYQINLLRYFSVIAPQTTALAHLLVARGGPWSSWIRQGTTDVISFSPEQFTSVQAGDHVWRAVTRPIKGTIARDTDPAIDQRAADALLASIKDRAELHMIIDLMRNDLARISRPGSVCVTRSAELQSFVNVHHLVGQVEGVLAQGLAVRDFLQALCPAGSITGAPKIEVMHAIRGAEGRPRGYFMGNAFLYDHSGRFDSSVLIRTMVGRHSGAGNTYEFSAGSGIVISSDPRSERLEINAKCNVLFPEE